MKSKKIIIVLGSVIAALLVHLLFYKNDDQPIAKQDPLRFKRSDSQPKEKLNSLLDLLTTKQTKWLSKKHKDAWIPGTPDPETHLSYEDLIEKLKNNDVCNFNPHNYKRSDRIKAVMAAPDIIEGNPVIDRTILALFMGGPLVTGKEDSKPTEDFDFILEFYNAMLLGGYINQYNLDAKHKRDDSKAEEIFRYLEEEHPENGVFAFCRAGILHRLGADQNEVRAELIRALDAPKFDFYLQQVVSRLHQKSFYNPAHFLASLSVLQLMPIPNLIEPMNLLHKLIENENDEEFITKAKAFAYKLKPQNIPPDGNYEFFEWSGSNYIDHIGLLKKIRKVTGVENGPPLKEFKDVVTYYDDPEYKKSAPSFENWFDDKECNKEGMERELAVQLEKYKKYLSTYGKKKENF